MELGEKYFSKTVNIIVDVGTFKNLFCNESG